MKRLLIALLAILMASPAAAQLPGGSEIQVNITPIIGGTTGRCLYDNSGRVGEQACGGAPSGAAGGDLTGTYPNPTIKASVSLTTPNINVATGTSLALGGATLGSNALAVTGTTALGSTTTITPATANTSALVLTGGAVTALAPLLDMTRTWNNAGVIFTAIKLDVTNTASSTSSLLIDLQLGGATQFNVSRGGNITGTGNFTMGSTGILSIGSRLKITSTVNGTMNVFATDGTTPATVVAGTATLSTLASDAATTNNTVCATTTTGVLTKGSGTLGICLGTSSARFKHDILDAKGGIDRISALRPVSYKYNGGDERALYGFVAEEVAKVMPELVALGPDGKPNSVDMLGMVPFLVNSIKELRGEIAGLRSK